MPLYNIATYASVREEWAVRADNLEHARVLIGDDPSGESLDVAAPLESAVVEERELVCGDDETVTLHEITPAHWAWRAANADQLTHSLHQSIAAVAAEFHAHWRYDAFYDRFSARLNGFPGITIFAFQSRRLLPTGRLRMD